jgi:hypothetical protein
VSHFASLFSARLLQANGKRNGFGVLKLSNGDVFEGIWANDVRSGFGMIKFASGEEYKGGWEDNKFHGSAFRSASSFALQLLSAPAPALIVLFAGKGTLKHVNGDIFFGEFQDGLAHGDALCLFPVQLQFT